MSAIAVLFHKWMESNQWKIDYSEQKNFTVEQYYEMFLNEQKIQDNKGEYYEVMRQELVKDFEKDLANKDKEITQLKEKLNQYENSIH